MSGLHLTSSDPRRDFALITQHEGGQCDDVQVVLDYPSIEDGWQNVSDEHLWWAVETFCHADEVVKLKTVWRSVRQIVLSSLPNAPGVEHLITSLQRDILRAFKPSLREIYINAQPSVERWAKMALERIPEEKWRAG